MQPSKSVQKTAATSPPGKKVSHPPAGDLRDVDEEDGVEEQQQQSAAVLELISRRLSKRTVA